MKNKVIIFLAGALFITALITFTTQLVKSDSTGTVSIFVEMPPYEINITAPLNTTYNLSLNNYSLQLNVTSNFSVNTWWFNLYDLKHAQAVNTTVVFTPNATFNAVRWSNRLEVYANDSDGRIMNKNVTFTINVNNSAPYFTNLNDIIYGCEDQEVMDDFTITDIDEQFSETYFDYSITPASPLLLTKVSPSNATVMTLQIIFNDGALPNSEDVGLYARNISITDNQYTDTKSVNISILQVNDAPVLQTIGARTLVVGTLNGSFNYQIQVTDEEDGNQNAGKLSFNISFSPADNLFNISQTGVMNFTPNSTQNGTYQITVCVADNNLSTAHANLSQCYTPGIGTNQSVCETLSFTITNNNTAPNITSRFPTNLTFSLSGTSSQLFNISKYDAEGTRPDTYWYVDNVFKERDTNTLADEFTYTFGCGVSGAHAVKTEITDGLLNSSVQWNITVQNVDCTTSTSTGGGGGGGGAGTLTRAECEEKWACYEWQPCQSAEKSFSIGILEEQDFALMKSECSAKNWNEETCGFQVRTCFDAHACKSLLNRPKQIRQCQFTINPACADRIKNCHDGSCELLVDCGGPCTPCPTCSDGIQNQGEANIDCSGPCPINCSPEKPLIERPMLRYPIIAVIIIALIIFIIKLKKVLKLRNK